MLALSEKGDNASVDMLVGDIYGQDYGRLGLKSTTIASSFGKVFKKGGEKVKFSPEDISRSLLYAVSNNIGQIAYMNAEKYGLDRIYFGGYFIRGRFRFCLVPWGNLIDTLHQGTLLLSAPCRMQYGSGVKEPSGHFSCAMKVSCTSFFLAC